MSVAVVAAFVGFWACSVEVEGPDGPVTVTLTGVDPVSGPTTGGTVITVRGRNFTKASAVDSVRFGGVKAPLVTVNNDSVATVTTPPHPAGTVAVTLWFHAGDTVSIPNAFTFVPPGTVPNPLITSIIPSSGLTTGGTAIAINGSGFQSGLTVSIGGASAGLILVTSTVINATTPAGTVGAKNVIVTNPDGKSDTATFTYTPPSTGTPIFSDGFESGDKTNSQNGFGWTDGSPAVVSNTHKMSGTYSLRFTLSGSNPEQRFNLGQNLTELWIEWYQYWPNGTEGLGARYAHRDGPSSDNNKFLRLWAQSYDPPTRFKVGSSTRPVLNANLDSYVFLEYAKGGGIMDAYSPYTAWNPAITNPNRGRWVQIRHHVKVATAANNDGVFQVWADGVLVLNQTNIDMYPAGGVENYMRNGYLMGSQNSGYDATTYTYIDDFKLYNANPGW